QAVNFAAEPDVLLELIYTQTGKLIDTTNFYIILHRPEVNALTYGFFLEGHERFEQNEGRAFRDNIGLEGEVIRTGRPIRTDDYLAECARRGVQARPESKHYAWMGVPLNAGNETLGAMVVASFIPGVTFTDEQLKVFWAIADQAATALDKARLFRETEVRALQLQSLNEISTQLSSTLDLENLLSRIMRSAVEILQCDAGSLFLVDEDTGDLVFRVVEGGAQDLVGQRIQWGMGIVGQVAETREPVIVHNVSEDTRWLRDLDEQTEFETESILAVPLLIHDESLGVLEVINKRDGSPFTGDDIALLTTFAGQAAVAIENARLYEATDAALSARVDELQNLQRIDRELNRTLNFDRVLSITLDWALRVTGASAGMIAMLPAEGEGLQIAVSQGYRDDFIAEYSEKPLPLSMGIAGRVMSTGTPEFSADATEDEQFVNVAKQPSVAQITVPILRANTPIGILVIESSIPGLFSTTDFEFIQRLVEHAAVAIENARLVQGIERANLEKTDLMRTIAHELNNPMTSIKGYTDLLLTGAISEDMQNQFLNTIRNNTDRMRRIVDDLRDVAHIDSGQLKLQRTAVDPVAPVDVTVRSLQSLIEDKEQHLEMHIEDDLPPIYADNTRLEQIMTNLISNAHKYTPEGGTIEIRATLETVTDEATGQQQDVVHYVVRDTGIGMSEDDLAQLFTKFFRTQRGKEMAKGTGLGLVITKSLVEDHGGQIWVESEVGVGTTFHFTIPAADVPETEEGTTAG
ncbi:MAG: GAF domain-containing sensor histidine kinase, partial [Chloroflexi bacterium]|nr:GAF domain-containing sensor histidine kinase [Chloroflexota bacterium]